jgi:Ca2+-binding RTX toxin-like protein
MVDGKEDTIADFRSGTDTIQLAKSVFAALGASVSAGEFHQGTSAQDGNDHLVYTKSTGELFYDANGSENGGLHLFARLDAGATLTFSDFDIL